MPNQKLWSLVSVCHILERWIKRHLCGRGCTIPVVVHWGNDIQTIYCYIFSASSLKVNIIYTHLKYSRPTFISTYIYIWICIRIIFLWIFLFPLQCFHSKFTFLQDFQIIKKYIYNILNNFRQKDFDLFYCFEDDGSLTCTFSVFSVILWSTRSEYEFCINFAVRMLSLCTWNSLWL